MSASIDLELSEGRPRRKSNQFDFPCPKGDEHIQPKYRSDSFHRSLRKSPVLAVSDDYYTTKSLTKPEDSVEMSMKTIEMLALIKGATPEEACLMQMAQEQQRSQSDQDRRAVRRLKLGSASQEDDGQTSTEGSSATSLHPQPTAPTNSNSSGCNSEDYFELDFDDDYLLGDSFIGYSEEDEALEKMTPVTSPTNYKNNQNNRSSTSKSITSKSSGSPHHHHHHHHHHHRHHQGFDTRLPALSLSLQLPSADQNASSPESACMYDCEDPDCADTGCDDSDCEIMFELEL